ncbi:hypothetical protein D5086_003309 [Populus alba]|uniref:Uncharacterized protein n=1 Tax=Populus alba TaxID=43335 RepID=A0ACC4D4S6_POPAL
MEMKGGGLVSATAVSTPNLVVITAAVVARVVVKDQPSFIGESSLTPDMVTGIYFLLLSSRLEILILWSRMERLKLHAWKEHFKGRELWQVLFLVGGSLLLLQIGRGAPTVLFGGSSNFNFMVV